jgi:hypothetical protein
MGNNNGRMHAFELTSLVVDVKPFGYPIIKLLALEITSRLECFNFFLNGMNASTV